MKSETDRTIIKVSAIFCISMLEATALILGYDGALFTLVVGAIAGLAGYEIGKHK